MDFLMNIAHILLQTSSWITNHKELLAVVVSGSGAVSLLLEPVKKWLALQSHTMITVLHYLFALIAVGLHYIATSSSKNPVALFAQALIILGTNQFVYPLLTKPLSALFSDAKAQADVLGVATQVEKLASDFKG